MPPTNDIMNPSLLSSVVLSLADTAGVSTFGVVFDRNGLAAAGILLVALFLGLWQKFDQRSRDADPSPRDRDFFRRQDRRRYVGIAVMVSLGIAIYLLTPVLNQPKGNELWLIGLLSLVSVLIVVLLALAVLDWLATRRYARRHRRALNHERSKLMLEMIHRAGSSDSGDRSSDEKSKT